MLFVVWSLLFLAMSAYIDVKKKIVYVGLCIVNMMAAIIVHLLYMQSNWIDIVSGMFIGVFVFLISVLLKEKIGKGDAWIMITIGMIEGGNISFAVLVWALVICSIVSIIGLVINKYNIKTQVSFIPYIFVGNVIVALIFGGNV